MGWNAADIPDQHGRVAVVTGANGGLGLETARQLAAKGAHVVMAVRNQEKAAAAVADIRASAPDAALELVALDLASQASVRAAAAQVAAAHPWRAYGQAKLANFHFGLGLARELEQAGASAASLIAHPGLSNTDLQVVSARESGGTSQRLTLLQTQRTGMTPADGALSQLRAATDPAAKSGEFYGPRLGNSGPPVRRPVLRRLGLDKAIATLWAVSERETGVAIDLRAAMPA